MNHDRNAFSYRSLLLPTLALGSVLLADPAAAEWVSKTDQPGWLPFLGRLHMVVLHLPIGLLMGAFILELLGMLRRSKGYDNAAAWTLVLGAGSAWVACTTGWLLEETDPDGFTSLTFGWHKWLAISLAILATIAAVLKIIAIRKQWKPAADGSGEGMHPGGTPLLLARLGLVGIMILLPVTGHLGGNMVHGQEFLTERSPIATPDFIVRFPNSLYASDETDPDATGDGGTVTTVSNNVQDWNDSIQPILNAKCTDCHSEAKDNGDYRLDTLEWAMKDGETEYIAGISDPPKSNIVPGSPIESELYYRVAVPESHLDFMPTKGDGFTPEEIDLLGNWIRAFDGKLQGPTPSGGDGDGTAAQGGGDEPAGGATASYDPAIARRITDAGATVQPLSIEENPEQMVVRFAYRSEDIQPGALKALQEAGDVIARLELQGSAVADADLADLPAMPRITYLNLKDTAITDAGLANLPAMPALDWLNLFGTEITDAGLPELAKYTALKKVYLTGTAVTESAVATLRAALPDAEVFADFDLDTPDADAEAGAADAISTTPINTTCPVDTDAAVKPEFTTVYEGRTIGFCCEGCKAKFEADPASFVAELPPVEGGEPGADAGAALPVNTECPVSGAAVDAAFTSVFNETTVAFCCGNCKAKFDADPAAFAAKLP